MAHTMILWLYMAHRIMICAIYHDINVIFCLIKKFVANFCRPKYRIFSLSAHRKRKFFMPKEPHDIKAYLEHLVASWIQRYQNLWRLGDLLLKNIKRLVWNLKVMKFRHAKKIFFKGDLSEMQLCFRFPKFEKLV